MKAINLRCEYLVNPIGIDIRSPRLFWNCSEGIKQTAFKIKAFKNGVLDFETEKIVSSNMYFDYLNQLSSRDVITWQVALFDENDVEGEYSPLASFEMGLLNPIDWQTKWIRGDYKVNKKQRYPIDCFKKEIPLKNISSARLYVTALGLYEAKINGENIGRSVLNPGYTDYKKRVQYQTYDVTNLLKNGNNVLEVELADGWYRGSTGAWGIKNQYGTATKLLYQLEVTHEDGKVTTVYSDHSWKWSNDGPLSFADNKDGEIVDARKKPSYKGFAKEDKYNVIPSASNNVPVVERETLKGKLFKTPQGCSVLDVKQNIAGYISFKLEGKAGQSIKLRFGELLDKEGEFTQKNIQLKWKDKNPTPMQEIFYVFKDGVNEYKTKFAVFGFQYVLIETDVSFSEEDFTAVVVGSDIKSTLEFDSSNELLNKFIECSKWSTINNSLDIPTDCPTRERHGWTGDAQVFFKSASYLFDYSAFIRKFYNDMLDEQKKNGCFKQISPNGGVDFYMQTMDGSPGWSDAGILLPYRFYKVYNDERILVNNYEAMKRYAKFIMKRCGSFTLLRKPLHIKGKGRRYLVNRGQSYGEWAEPNDVCAFVWTDFVFPHPEVATAYAHYIFDVMEEIAHLLGKNEDEHLYKKFKEGTKLAYQGLIKKKQFPLDTDQQARLVRPLYFDLLNDESKKYAKERLIKALDNYNWRVGTGFLSTPLILYVLEDIDIEYAYRLLENEEMPGWLYMPKTGATTIWEGWEGHNSQSGIGSLNHYSKGAALEWVISSMCGINVDKDNHFTIKPRPGGHFEYANASYQSVYGLVKCGWKKQEKEILFNIEIPSNCTATILLPDGNKEEITTGTYTFATK